MNSLYQRMGGEPVLKQFVTDLYAFMDKEPNVAKIRAMHHNLSYAADRLFMFLSGMLGGPPLYMDAFGPPRLRRKHMPFSIGNEERDQWMSCAKHAAQQLHISDELKNALINTLAAMADHLRNQETAQQMQPCTHSPSVAISNLSQ